MTLDNTCPMTLDILYMTLYTRHMTLMILVRPMTLYTWHLTLKKMKHYTWYLTNDTRCMTLSTWCWRHSTWHLTPDADYLTHDMWLMTLWHMILGTWHMALDTWHLAHDNWHLTKKYTKKNTKKPDFQLNKAFVGLGSCDNVQTERSIFKYANWPKLQK